MDDVENYVLIKGLSPKQNDAAKVILADAYMLTKTLRDIEKPSLVLRKEAQVESRELYDNFSYDSGALKLTFPVEKGDLDPIKLRLAVEALHQEIFKNPLTKPLTIALPNEKATRKTGTPQFRAVDAVVISHPIIRGEGVDPVRARELSELFVTLQYERVDLLLQAHGQQGQCWRAQEGIDGRDRNGRTIFIEHPSVVISKAAVEKVKALEALPDLPPMGG
jgi:hypothetical protein